MTKISIITINYNNVDGLKRTFDSVVSQTSIDFEYIIIDGGSNDGSKQFLEQNDSNIHHWISEPDSGVYNAMNKGIEIAKGDYLLFLNSGDYLVSSSIISEVVENIDYNHQIYYGNIYFSKDKKKIQIWTLPDDLSYSFFLKYSLPHPASFIKRELFKIVFNYNESLKIVSDWEFFIVSICKFNVSYKHLNLIVSDFDTSGISNNPNNLFKINDERDNVLKTHFPLFYEDSILLKEIESKRFIQFLNLKNSNNFKWKLIKFIFNLMFISNSKKQHKRSSMIKQL